MSQLGRYMLLQRLGSSVLGSLYKAQDTTTGSAVALRVVHLGLLDEASSSQMDARLSREVGAASRLLHPGIARVFEIRREGRTALIASELVEGPTITSYVAAPSGSDLSKVVTAAIQLLEALEFAHSQSVIHRNLRPANVRVQGTRVCVADFGIADLATGDDPDASATADNTEYMAPEQFLNAAVDHRCDVHAAGAIIYEMLTGKSPFAGDANRLTAMSKVLELVPPPPSQVRVGLPPIFDQVLGRALAKSSAQRFDSARQFRDELSAAYAALMRPPTTVIQPKASRPVADIGGSEAAAVRKPVAAERNLMDRTAPLPEVEPLQPRAPAGPPPSTPPREAIRPATAPSRGAPKEAPLSGGTILVKPKPADAAALAAPAVEVAAVDAGALVSQSVPIEAVLAQDAALPAPGGTVLAKPKPAAVLDGAAEAKESARPPSPVDAPVDPHATPLQRPRLKEDDTIWISGKHNVSELLASIPLEPPAAAAADARTPMRNAPPSSKPAVPLTEATVAHGGRVLARFVGPIASVFSRRAAQQAQDERGYFELLAGHLTDASERNRFLREVRKRPG